MSDIPKDVAELRLKARLDEVAQQMCGHDWEFIESQITPFVSKLEAHCISDDPRQQDMYFRGHPRHSKRCRICGRMESEYKQ